MVQTLGANPYLLVACVTMLVFMLYRYLKDTYSVLEKLGIPGPKPIWVFGNVLEFKGKEVLDVFKEWKDKYGKVYGFYEGLKPGVVVNDPDFAKEILSQQFDKFYIRTSYRPFQYYPDDLQLVNLMDGQHWKNQRSVLNKTLNLGGAVKQVIKKLQRTSDNLIKCLEESRQLHPTGVNISGIVERFTSESVLRIVLDMEDEDIREHGQLLYEYELASNYSASAENEAGGLARLFPSLTPILKLADRKHKLLHETVVDILLSYITQTVTYQNNNKVKKEDYTSIMSCLMASQVLTRDIDGSLIRRPLTNDEIVAHILAMLSETYQTSMAIVKYLLYELACNMACQEELYDEICHVCGEDGDITNSAIQSMSYFDMFFNETYRLHPVAPGVSRICTEDCMVKSLKLKKGMVVRVMTSTMYNDETIFPQPGLFDPHRFSEENKKDMHQFAFLPFGQGPRMCPGQKLAMLQIKTVIINVLRHYTLSTCDMTQIPLKNALRPSLCPANGVYLKLTQRICTMSKKD